MISTEMRYFFEPATLPRNELIKAFELQPEAGRTDHYHLFEKASSTGVKWREGRLEVKSLISQDREDGILLSHWEKITVKTADTGPSENYVPIQKNRWTVYLNQQLQKTRPGEGLTCQVEYCQLSIRDKKWESLCVEASGGVEEELKKLAVKVYQSLLKEMPELKYLLRDENRKGYPELIFNHTFRKGR